MTAARSLLIQQRIPLGGRVGIDAIAEVFNVFNVENFTLVAEEGADDFGEPEDGQFRTMQFGFRVTF